MDPPPTPPRAGSGPGPGPGVPGADEPSASPRRAEATRKRVSPRLVPGRVTIQDRLRGYVTEDPANRRTAPRGDRALPGSRTPAAEKPEPAIGAILADRMLLTAFQPIVDLTSGAIAGAEAFTRFTDGTSNNADEWFTAAAQAGLGSELEFAALETAIGAAAQLPPHLYVALKVSPAVCLDPLLPGLLLNSDLPPARVVLQLTEALTDDQTTALGTVLAPLRRHGVRLAVDHAGSYTDSIRHLQQLDPDMIKIDRTLIAGIDTDYLRHAFGAAMAGLTGKLGAELIAAGIETRAELTAVRSLGMTAGQGYFLGRPTTKPDDWSRWRLGPGKFPFRTDPDTPPRL